jgi:hypothetical protein
MCSHVLTLSVKPLPLRCNTWYLVSKTDFILPLALFTQGGALLWGETIRRLSESVHSGWYT